MTWPGGFGTKLRLDGRAPDLLTPLAAALRVLAQDELRTGVGQDRTLEDIEVAPGPARSLSARRRLLRDR